MTAEQLRTILQSNNNLTIAEIKNIIYELNQDCFWEICKLGKDLLDTTKIEYNVQNIAKEKFYQGETNAFYICLDLLEKLGDE